MIPRFRMHAHFSALALAAGLCIAQPLRDAPAGPSAAPKAAGSKAQGPVVITVGPNKIRRSQIDTLVDLMVKAKKASENMDAGEKRYLERMIATNLIGQELLDLEAKRLKVVAGDKDIDSLINLFRGNFPSEDAFRRALKQAGDTEKGLREKMARQIKADKLLNAQVAPVDKPTAEEMRSFFASNKKAFPINDSLRACQIVLLVDKSSGSQGAARRKAELDAIRADLAKDTGKLEVLLTRFVHKAREVSEGPEKQDGGDLQRFLPGDFFPEFKKQVAGLQVGELSQVFRSPMGWHLVLLTERNDGKFESYRLHVAQALAQQKSAAAGKDLKKYLKTLADRYKVTYLEQTYRDSSLAGVYQP